MTKHGTVIYWLVAYSTIVLIGYAFALQFGDSFTRRIIVTGVLVGCCVDAILRILAWPKERNRR